MHRERDDRAGARLEDVAQGWAVPLALQDGRPRDGRPDPVVDTARLVLEIVPGERRLLPGFGCRVHELPRIETEAERQLAAVLVEESLKHWVPALGVERAEVLSVEDDLVYLELRVSGDRRRLRIRHRHGLLEGAAHEVDESDRLQTQTRPGVERVQEGES